MATIRCSRTLPASPAEVWAIVGDPYHMPRWWPRVLRVEGVEEDGFTQVLSTDKGRSVRADFRVLESVSPALRRWTQELVGTPFERILAVSETEVRIDPAGRGTQVTMVRTQTLRGMARLGAFMLRRASKAQLDEALSGLQALLANSR